MQGSVVKQSKWWRCWFRIKYNLQAFVVNCSTNSTIQKIKELASSCKEAHKVKNQTGKSTEQVYAACKYFDILEPLLGSCPSIKPLLMNKDISTGIVVWLEVSSLRVMGSTPTQWTGLCICHGRPSDPPPAQAGALARANYNILSQYMGSRLRKPTVCTRPGGHRRQMEAWPRISCWMGYA